MPGRAGGVAGSPQDSPLPGGMAERPPTEGSQLGPQAGEAPGRDSPGEEEVGRRLGPLGKFLSELGRLVPGGTLLCSVLGSVLGSSEPGQLVCIKSGFMWEWEGRKREGQDSPEQLPSPSLPSSFLLEAEPPP